MDFDFSTMPRISREALRKFKKEGKLPLKWRLSLDEQCKIDKLLSEATGEQLRSPVGRDDYGHSARRPAKRIIENFVAKVEAIPKRRRRKTRQERRQKI